MPSHAQQPRGPQGQGQGKGKAKLVMNKRFSGAGKEKRDITNPAIRRLAFQARIVRTSSSFYDACKEALNEFVETTINRAVIHMDYNRRKTIMSADIVKALSMSGSRTTYGDFTHKLKIKKETPTTVVATSEKKK